MSDIKNFVAMEASLNSYVNNVITSLLSDGGISKIVIKSEDAKQEHLRLQSYAQYALKLV